LEAYREKEGLLCKLDTTWIVKAEDSEKELREIYQ
tara:strand:- start:70 stop:174 length:105 start_codon:yes stop_codon:yes gene_type:complete